jgi:hypothetical protein
MLYKSSMITERPPLPRDVQVAAMREFVAGFGRAVEQTRDMRKLARHYRLGDPYATEPPVLVASFALAADLDGRTGWFGAANQNLAPGDNPTKMCSERKVIPAMQADELPYLIGMITSGTVQPDKQSGRASLVLPTCGICRPVIESVSVPGCTLAAQSHPYENVHEIDTPDELIAKHRVGGTALEAVAVNVQEPTFNVALFDMAVAGELGQVPRDARVADIARYALGLTPVTAYHAPAYA